MRNPRRLSNGFHFPKHYPLTLAPRLRRAYFAEVATKAESAPARRQVSPKGARGILSPVPTQNPVPHFIFSSGNYSDLDLG